MNKVIESKTTAAGTKMVVLEMAYPSKVRYMVTEHTGMGKFSLRGYPTNDLDRALEVLAEVK